MNSADVARLEQARAECGLSTTDLWIRYYSLGGNGDEIRLARLLRGDGELDSGEYDVIAHALNERFSEQGKNSPVPYSDELPG